METAGQIEYAVRAELAARGLTVATAESLTGGQLAARITSVPGASAVYVGGAVTYATEFKHALLGVSREIIDGPGVVSPQCAVAMARGVAELAGTDVALATTGVAGPDPQEGKPVGTVFIGLATPTGDRAFELKLAGRRADIQAQTCDRALEVLLEWLQS